MKKKASIVLLAVVSVILIAGCYLYLQKYGKTYTYQIDAFEATEDNTQSPESIFRKGNYIFQISYSATDVLTYVVQGGSSYYAEGQLSQGENQYLEIPVTLSRDTTAFYLKFKTPYADAIKLEQVTVVSDQLLDTDMIYFMVLIVLSFIILSVMLWNWDRISAENKKVLGILLLGFLIANIPNYEPIIRFGTDIRVHLLRIEGIKDGLIAGQFPVILYPDAFNGFGEIGCLYPKLFLYPAAFLRICGVSLLTSYKTLIYFISITTLLVTYFASKSICKDKIISAVVSVLYLLFPYRMYVMGYSSSTLGRGMSMIFFPLVVAGLYHILRGDKHKWPLLVWGITGILQSHLLNFVIAILFVLITCFVFWKDLIKKESLITLMKAAIVSVLLNIGFLTQFLGYYFAGLNLDYLKFNVYDKLFSIEDFLTSPWNLVGIFYLLCAYIFFRKEQSGKDRKIFCYLAVTSIMIFIMSSVAFPWFLFLKVPILNSIISTFQNIKRFYIICAYLLPLMFGIWVLKRAESRSFVKWSVIGIVVATVGVIIPYQEYFGCDVLMDRITGYTENEQIEYLPEGTQKDYYISNAGKVSDESVIHCTDYIKNGSDVVFTYTSTADNGYVEVPLFYYKGYQAVDESNRLVSLEKGEKNRIRIWLQKSDTPSSIHIFFKVSPIYTIMTVVSLIAMGIFTVFTWKNRAYLKGYIYDNEEETN